MTKRLPVQPEGALYVRLPAAAVDKLDRASETLGISKKDLIAGLVAKYVDPDSRSGLQLLGGLRFTVDDSKPGPTMGRYSFQSYEVSEPPEVMNVVQTGELLQLEAHIVLELAEAGTLPGRKLGPEWRFSRSAVLAWLAATS